MLTHAAPHHGLGVDQYIWATSPLRRYPDLLNQWQILACIEHGVAAPLAAPFKPRDADLYAIVSAFEGIYAGYGEFQATIERYWCLRWLAQQQTRRAQAVVLKDELVRLTEIPLVLKLPGLPQLARGTQVELDLLHWDEVSLEVEARLHEVFAAGVASMAGNLDEVTDAGLDDAVVDAEADAEMDMGMDADGNAIQPQSPLGAAPAAAG
jgi:exoribonuclease-2